MATILDEIVASKRKEIAAARLLVAEEALRVQIDSAPAPRDFLAALVADDAVSLIAELKKASPSAGLIRENFDPVVIAHIYESHGAACISVLTDEPYFQGRLDDLRDVRQTVAIPVLRKDFILDSYQLLEARAAGADAVLLIAECLDDAQLPALISESVELGMTPLVELYEPRNLQRVLAAGATLVGVNNRNLHTFEVDLDHVLRLRDQVPDECVLVAESGIRMAADVERLRSAGVDAMLVGESLMRETDIGAEVDKLLVREIVFVISVTVLKPRDSHPRAIASKSG